MEAAYITLAGLAEERLVEKKSIFIANAAPVAEEIAAQKFLNEIRSRYPEAKHHVFAYICGDHNQFQRFSDAGEPAGTGGRPVLDVLKNQELTQAIVVVSRYFGGILLGTGGLSRAYGRAAAMAVAKSGLVKMVLCQSLSFTIAYLHFGKLQNYLESQAIRVQDVLFTDEVAVSCLATEDQLPGLEKFLQELSHGTVALSFGQIIYQPQTVLGGGEIHE